MKRKKKKGSFAPLRMTGLLTCEHASNAVPRNLSDKIRIPESVLRTHRGWDPGTPELARAILDAIPPARRHGKILSGKMTRLLVDLNRSESNPDVFSKWGHQNLDTGAREKLLKIHRAYRKSARAVIDRLLLTGENHVIHLSIHSFTPVLRGQRRTTDIGILFDPARTNEAKLARRLIRILQTRVNAAQLRGIRIHANKPYAGTADGHTTELRAKLPPARYSGIEIEVNQKFVRKTVQARWAGIVSLVAAAVRELLEHGLGEGKHNANTAHGTRHVRRRIQGRLPGRGSESHRRDRRRGRR